MFFFFFKKNKNENYRVIGYARKSKGTVNDEVRINFIRSICQRLKEQIFLRDTDEKDKTDKLLKWFDVDIDAKSKDLNKLLSLIYIGDVNFL